MKENEEKKNAQMIKQRNWSKQKKYNIFKLVRKKEWKKERKKENKNKRKTNSY